MSGESEWGDRPDGGTGQGDGGLGGVVGGKARRTLTLDGGGVVHSPQREHEPQTRGCLAPGWTCCPTDARQ